jgi:hypothetical protein
MQRYAVLNDLDTPTRRPVGLAIEQNDRVRLVLSGDYGLRTEFREAYRIVEPDGGELFCTPGHREYFDQVLVTLSRAFLVSDVQQVAALDNVGTLELFHERVVSKQPRPGPGEYAPRPPLRVCPGQHAAPARDGAPPRSSFGIAA